MKNYQPIAEINFVPFIDVMLVLLVVFMITTPLLTEGVNVDLPQAQTVALPLDTKQPLIVSVDEKGNFYVNFAAKPSQPVTARMLAGLAKTVLDAQPREVFVRADKNVSYGKVMEAMVILQQSGAKAVGLVTVPRNGQKETGEKGVG